MENKVKKLEFDIIGENEVKVRVKNGILIGFENGNVNAYIGNISASQYIDAVLIMHRIVDEIGAGKAFEEWSIQSLAEYASTGLTPDQIREMDKLYLEKCQELVAERKKQDWLFNDGTLYPEQIDLLKQVEEALGLRLFHWQKEYICNGTFRRYGRTTAMILRELLLTEAEPLDFSKASVSPRQAIFRNELRLIQEKLQKAGIKTRVVFYDEQQKRGYRELKRIIYSSKEE